MTGVRSATPFQHPESALSNESATPPSSAPKHGLAIAADPKGLLPWPQLCMFNRHKPRSKDVTWDGTHYVGECKRCGNPIRRVRHQMWLRDWHQR